MRIGIDARLYTQTGVGRYIRNLIAQLGILDDVNEYFVYLRGEEFPFFTPPNKRWKKRLLDIPWHTLTEQLLVPQILKRDELEVAHFPYFNVPILYNKKYLLTIHDLIINHFNTGKASTLPQPFYKAKRFGYQIATSVGIKNATFITAISQATKSELIDHYRIDLTKIKVTYDAVDSNFLKVAKTHKAQNYYNFPYILYVGNAYPHKNLEKLILAFKVILKNTKIKLVLVGDDEYFYPRLQDFSKYLGISDNIVFFGNADDKQLVDLYSYTRCLVFPSLMEGFGLPNLEALVCNKLPVISDIPVFHEIWGNRLDYFDPNDVKKMAESILMVLHLSPKIYQRKVQEAKKRVEDFSWNNTAYQTLKIYKQIHEASLL